MVGISLIVRVLGAQENSSFVLLSEPTLERKIAKNSESSTVLVLENRKN